MKCQFSARSICIFVRLGETWELPLFRSPWSVWNGLILSVGVRASEQETFRSEKDSAEIQTQCNWLLKRAYADGAKNRISALPRSSVRRPIFPARIHFSFSDFSPGSFFLLLGKLLCIFQPLLLCMRTCTRTQASNSLKPVNPPSSKLSSAQKVRARKAAGRKL